MKNLTCMFVSLQTFVLLLTYITYFVRQHFCTFSESVVKCSVKITSNMDFIQTFTVTKETGSKVKIEGEIPFEELQKERTKAIEHLGANVEIDGFRKGKVPETMLVQKLGEMQILTEMAERAMARVYPEVLKEHNIDAIGHPQIQITKIAPDNPLGFVATVAVMPEMTLPDYKAIATEVNKDKASADVTDEDLENQIKDILRQKIAYERLQKKAVAKAETTEKDLGDATELPTPESEAAKADAEEADKPVDDSELPELTDEYVKGLGQPGQFESVDDFKTKLREHLGIEKEREVTAAHRAKITDAIIEKTEVELPQLMIDSEINQMFAQMQDDLTRANLKFEDYLNHIKKTQEDLVKEWTPAAEKRAKLQLILNEIAKAEKIEPNQGLVDEQVERFKEQYKDADETRVRIYVSSVLTNDAVVQMLEQA